MMNTSSVNYQFRSNDVSRLRGAEATAYANAMKLKAEVTEAREASPQEVLEVNKPEQFAQAPGMGDWVNARQTLSSVSRGADGEIQSFLQNDDKAGQQFKIAGSVASGMIGGMAGALFMLQGETYSKSIRHEDGHSTFQTLQIDSKTGAMSYSEWEMPALPGGSHQVSSPAKDSEELGYQLSDNVSKTPRPPWITVGQAASRGTSPMGQAAR
jgi:hypothetical protein